MTSRPPLLNGERKTNKNMTEELKKTITRYRIGDLAEDFDFTEFEDQFLEEYK